MIKYRVHEVAKDLGVASREMLDLLGAHLGLKLKSMSALSKSELDFVFEYYTQKYSVDSFDSYFSSRKIVAPNVEDLESILAQYRARAEGSSEVKSEKKVEVKKGKRPREEMRTIVPKGPPVVGESKLILESDVVQPEPQKVIDTRQDASVNIEKYSERYDFIAAKSAAKNQLESPVFKQKIHQKTRQNRRFTKKRESESERLLRIAKERKEKPMTVYIPEEITVGELAVRLKASVAQVIKKLVSLGIMSSVNDLLDFETASLVALEFHAKVLKEVRLTIEERIIDDSEDKPEDLRPRAPVVVVMGHVDHGKTSLLDKIRKSNIVSKEHGGITQHIGAYKTFFNEKSITFLDTPGHEAFTRMRARGAKITDIAVLVVAADDGVMPQTIEAVNHVREANVPVIVAVNKIDKPEANAEKIKHQLSEHGLISEEWGGDVPFVNVSAFTGEGINDLLEMILIVSEMKELKVSPDRSAKGAVVEARLDKGRGPIASLLVSRGTLKYGDIVVAGTALGRVRSMVSDNGEILFQALPSDPVEITGLDSVPRAGDEFDVVSDEKLARQLVDQRRFFKENERLNSGEKVTLENLFEQMQSRESHGLKLIIKADVQGSVEAVRQSLEKISVSGEDGEVVKVDVIHEAAGAINESDVMLAEASCAIIVGFNVRPSVSAAESAKIGGVEIKLYRVIYDCVQDIENAMRGTLVPKMEEIELGEAQCRKVYRISKLGVIAGCYVVSGKIERNSSVRVLRDGVVVAEDKIVSLRRYKDDIKEAVQGYECGIKLEKFSDIKLDDIFQAFALKEHKN
jgi:translation initiation factor IF-2